MAYLKEPRVTWFQQAAREEPLSLIHPLIGRISLTATERTALETIVMRIVRASAGAEAPCDPQEFLEAFEARRVTVDATSGSIVKINYNNFMPYMQVHHWLWAVLKRTGLLSRVTALSLMNVRCVLGQPTAASVETRAYATSKTHVDVWANEPEDIAHLWVPIFGDIARTTMEMFAPPDALFSERWMRPLSDYSEAQHLISETPLDLGLAFGTAILFDGACPHRTRRSNGTARMSLDVKLRRMPFEPDRRYASSYIPIEEFTALFDGRAVSTRAHTLAVR